MGWRAHSIKTLRVHIADGLHDLIFPPRCLGCGLLHYEVCGACAKELRIREYRSLIGSTPVFSSILYNPIAGHVLLAAKEDGIRKADDILVRALQHSLRHAMRDCELRPTLVPIPHSKRAIRKRGRNFVAEISDRLSQSESLPVRQLIRHNRKISDQSLLDAAARLGNVSGAMSVTHQRGRATEVMLVDDLMTTGATLGEAVRTLESAGFRVVAAVTALVALPLR